MPVNIQIRDRSARIAISGRFDFHIHRDFKNAYMPLLDNATLHEIEIEMSKVDYMDSSALGMLVLLNERAEVVNKTVVLLNASSSVSQLLEVANFSKIFNIKHTALFNTESRKIGCATLASTRNGIIISPLSADASAKNICTQQVTKTTQTDATI
ncbi:MAG: STAS domain-containing protein [Gallionella sp.]|nr:STAS domain-containing protein [Gallionella sp.]